RWDRRRVSACARWLRAQQAWVGPPLLGRRQAPRVLPVHVGDVVEEGEQPVVVALRDRVLLVVVAAGAADRHAQERLRGRRDDAVEHVVTGQQPVGRLVVRSEEHTSELQSLTNLVCRLLLAKKKKTITHTTTHINTHT